MDLNLAYEVGITESTVQEGLSDNELNIGGIAISETITTNDHQFLAEELIKAAPTLKDVPLLKDHENLVDNIVGRVTEANFDATSKAIKFKARVNDPKIKELIRDGRLKTVSIGAQVLSNEQNDEGIFTPRGITFKELSVVAVPADPSAEFAINLKASMSKDKMLRETIKSVITESQSPTKGKMKGGLINMAEEQDSKEEATETPETSSEEEAKPEESKEEETSKESEEPKSEDSSEDTTEALRKIVKSELAKMLKAADEESKEEAEEPKEESKEEPKEEAEESKDEATEEGYKITQSTGAINGGAFTLVRESY